MTARVLAVLLLAPLAAHLVVHVSALHTRHHDHNHAAPSPLSRRAPGDPFDTFFSTTTIAPWYSCDAAACVLPDCQCASTSPPGGLAASEVPQFVTLTIDDAVNAVVYDLPHQAMRGVRGADGCAMRATYFVSAQWTDYHSLQTLHALGHEIAGHTFTHSFPTVREMSAMREATEAFGGIPQSQIRGSRAPYLNYTLASLTSVKALGFDYDSSMTVAYAGASTIWPFTFDAGVPIACTTGDCTGGRPTAATPTPTWRAPGLWELPLYSLVSASGVPWAMDPAVSTAEFASMLRAAFQDHYSGNRAPFGVYLHANYLLADPQRIAVVNEFLTEIMAHPDVRFVTNTQLLAWLRNPVPLAAMDPTCPAGPTGASSTPEVCDGIDNNGNGVADEGLTKSCQFGAVTFATCKSCPVRAPTVNEPVPPLANDASAASAAANGCQPPLGGCVYGSFNAASCLCECTGSDDPNGAGACRNTLGACSTLRAPDPARPGFFLSCAQSSADQEKTNATGTATGNAGAGKKAGASEGSASSAAAAAIVAAASSRVLVVVAASVLALVVGVA
ncbi:hypothetical protein H9P43_008886 [Blastocladiella emersonii ATCC 22665]|nr:hypothetical protein H9P43_008886 [Blastocladiella emersonii ATCC 22665]